MNKKIRFVLYTGAAGLALFALTLLIPGRNLMAQLGGSFLGSGVEGIIKARELSPDDVEANNATPAAPVYSAKRIFLLLSFEIICGISAQTAGPSCPSSRTQRRPSTSSIQRLQRG